MEVTGGQAVFLIVCAALLVFVLTMLVVAVID